MNNFSPSLSSRSRDESQVLELCSYACCYGCGCTLLCLFSFWHSRHPHLFRDCETARLRKTLFQHMDEVAKSTSANEIMKKFGLIEKELMHHMVSFHFFAYTVALESPFWKGA